MGAFIVLVVVGAVGLWLRGTLARASSLTDLDEAAIHSSHQRLVLIRDPSAPEPAHEAYVRGDAEATEALIPSSSINTQVALYTALGQPRRAVESTGTHDVMLRGPARDLAPDALLVRINLADAYFELGDHREALRLLDDFPEGVAPLLDHGRWSSRAWILACLGQVEAASTDASRLDPRALGASYAAEGYMAKAKVALACKSWEAAESALAEAQRHVARASSDRNLIALTGEYWSRQGQLLEAEAQYRRAAEHRWKKQGGAFLLDWANVLEALGRSDEAVRALQQCVTQDPETPSAAEARKRVQAVAVPG